jgi:hypothetical protein
VLAGVADRIDGAMKWLFDAESGLFRDHVQEAHYRAEGGGSAPPLPERRAGRRNGKDAGSMIPRALLAQNAQRGGARLPPNGFSGPPTHLEPAAGMVPESRYSEGSLQVNGSKLNTLTTVGRH